MKSREEHWVSKYNVVWDRPSRNAAGSMPIGNGDIGLNVWAEEDGDLLFYIGKTDSWSESGRLLKLGRVRISLAPNPFRGGLPFRQELDLLSGSIAIAGGRPDEEVRIKLWADANHPVIYVELEGDQAFETTVSLELWRTETIELKGHALESANLSRSSVPVLEHADTAVEAHDDCIVWFHRNEHSKWPGILAHQGLGRLLNEGAEDPLLHRTFGGVIRGSGMNGAGAQRLRTVSPQRRAIIAVSVLTAQTTGEQEWLARAKEIPVALAEDECEAAFKLHCSWWEQFWNGSRIEAVARGAGAEEAYTVSRGYALQRFMNACSGRGAYPIKFNGSIFTFDVDHNGEDITGQFDADYRRWGAGYWFQNTRLPYWSMLASGDDEQMLPLFRMFADALPLARERTRTYFGHEGAYFPETMSFFGAYLNPDYGWSREGKPVHHIDNQYIRHYVQCNIELSLLMICHYEYTGDRETFVSISLPVITESLRFFKLHYATDDQDLLRFEPAQALENWHEAVNPLPDIAGLHVILERLSALPDIPEELQVQWASQLERMPPVPVGLNNDGLAVFMPAEAVYGEIKNTENVELYAVFPYRISGVGKDNLELGIRTFECRRFKRTGGWRQDAIQAACLGLSEAARELIVNNYSTFYEGARFPAFWGPNFDWMPDQDHGSVANIALQAMLLQTEGDRILICPAWPTDWDADFRLHAPHRTVVEGKVVAGKLVELKVTPEHRRNDVEVLGGFRE